MVPLVPWSPRPEKRIKIKSLAHAHTPEGSPSMTARRSPLPQPVGCPGCGAPLLVGWHGSTPLALDADAINLLGETAALVSGRRTYEVSGFGITGRCAQAITHVPQPKITDIHREHRCGTPAVTDPEKRTPKPSPYHGDEPPF